MDDEGKDIVIETETEMRNLAESSEPPANYEATVAPATSNSQQQTPEPTTPKFWETLTSILSSAEIPLALYFLAYGIFTPAQQHFAYWRTCLYRYNSATICEEIDISPDLKSEEAAVQADFSVFSTVFSITSYLPVLFIAILLGTWCDNFSHRIPMTFPHIGSVLVSVIYFLFAYLPNQAVNPVFLGAASLFSGLGGQTSVAVMATASYATMMTTGRSRTIRLAIIEAAVALGETFGYLINAFVFNGGRYYMQAFLTQIALDLYATVYIFALVKEKHKRSEIKKKIVTEANGSMAKYLCSPLQIIKSSIGVVFSKGTKRNRTERQWLLVMVLNYAFCVLAIGARATTQVLYAFVTLQPISIQPTIYAIFQATWAACLAFALSIVIRLLRLKGLNGFLPFSDAAIGIVGVFSRMLAMIFLGTGGFFPECAPWLYCILGMCSNFVFVSLRSGMSKLTDENEHGRIFAIICICENLFGLTASLGYNSLYGTLVSASSSSSQQIDYLIHGYTFLFVASIALLPLITFVWLGRQPIKNWSFHKSVKGDDLTHT